LAHLQYESSSWKCLVKVKGYINFLHGECKLQRWVNFISFSNSQKATRGAWGANHEKESAEGVPIGFKGGWIQAQLTRGGIPFGG
jgi:hypothetical protein